jgi:antitoxin component of MazEF toxin-antitoxin module
MLTESVVKTGNSLAVVIPSSFVRKLGIRPKDRVSLKINPATGKITYTFTNMRQLPLV